MALILNIESSTTNCSVSIAKNGELIHCIEKNDPDFKQSNHLHSFINKLLIESRIDLKQLDAISISKGPGSYTGLRVGAASAKGFCYSCEIPLIAINTLEILAAGYKAEKGTNIISLLDARRMEVYSMVLNYKHQVIRPTKAEIIDLNSFSDYVSNSKTVLMGSGAEKCKPFLKADNIYYPESPKYPSSKDMISIAETFYKNKNFQNIAYFEPYYLKDFYTIKKL